MESTMLEQIKTIYEAVTAGNWALGASLGLVVAVTLLRKYGTAKIPALGSKVGGYLTTYFLSFGLATATAFAGGAAFSFSIIIAAAKIAFMASGGYNVIKDVLLPLLLKYAPAWMQWALKPLAAIFDNSAIKAKAAAAGEAAVVASPATGINGVTGDPTKVE